MWQNPEIHVKLLSIPDNVNVKHSISCVRFENENTKRKGYLMGLEKIIFEVTHEMPGIVRYTESSKRHHGKCIGYVEIPHPYLALGGRHKIFQNILNQYFESEKT